MGRRYPCRCRRGVQRPDPAILLGMVIGNTIYPQIWKQCDGGVLFAKQHLLRLDYPLRLPPYLSQIADVGISGIVIDVLTLSSTFMLACFLGQKVFGLDRHTSWLIGAGSVSAARRRYWRQNRW